MRTLVHDEQLVELPNGTRLCYSSHGNDADPVVLLIVGLGLQLVYWPATLVHALVAQGYRVICFDNRDAGRSSRLDTPAPSRWQQMRGKAPAGAYGLEDMADDTALLLEHLGVQRAHVIGMSMGGMIGQVLAYRHPQRVRSLTSVFSTTGHRRVGQPAPSTLWRMARARRALTEAEAISMYTASMRHIGDATSPDIETGWAAYARAAWRRNGQRADARALQRQIGAIFKSGDRSARLRGIRAPTLVVHGDVDRMVAPSGGVATAKAIPGARLVSLPGMRHQIDDLQTERLVPLICHHFETSGH